ncbi:hypothetical protein EXD82_08805 [Peptacetobacter hominis]|uniref:ATP synthase subunit I n=1 Tax=Peptacetobacter hominis TaxID=2743610 RepID=A0A544QTH3_9FIRM|nr:ATP synthase subunit I [Peptacetobacter hominis]TQQ83987.1 hypothetical protein EXD82_08805 [Peptacetobacter hominis]
MDNCLKKQIKSVAKGIAVFDIVVMAVIFAVSKVVSDQRSNPLISELGKFDIASVSGILLGSIVAIFNFYMLTSATENLVNSRTGGSGVQFAGGYFLRFALCAVVLLIGAKVDSVSMLTAALGLLSTQIVLMVQKAAATIFAGKEE